MYASYLFPLHPHNSIRLHRSGAAGETDCSTQIRCLDSTALSESSPISTCTSFLEHHKDHQEYVTVQELWRWNSHLDCGDLGVLNEVICILAEDVDEEESVVACGKEKGKRTHQIHTEGYKPNFWYDTIKCSGGRVAKLWYDEKECGGVKAPGFTYTDGLFGS